MAPQESIKQPIKQPSKHPPALDRIDVKILVALQRNGRTTNEKLAATVALSPRACLERVRRLEAAGIIAGYQAVIEVALLSKPVTVFAEIALERLGNQQRFEQALTAIDELVECWEVSGSFDYLARFVCVDLARYEALTNTLAGDPTLGVARIVSHVTLRAIRRFAGYPDALLVRKAD